MAQRLTKLADCLSGAIEHARSAGLSDAQIADHLTGLGDRNAIISTLASDTDGSAVRFLVASLAVQSGCCATVTGPASSGPATAHGTNGEGSVR